MRESRREFLKWLGGGFGSAALAALLHNDAIGLDRTPHRESASGALGQPHHVAQARSVIQIFCPGGMSHIDTWDYKPELTRRTGEPFDASGELQFFASKPGACQGSYWKFRQRGQSGLWMSDLFPRLGECVDGMAFLYGMHSKSALHGPAMFMGNTGFILPGFPSMGAWVTYGLGCETADLPAFVVLPDPRGLPPGGVINWGAGFLPAVHQGTTLNTDPDRPPIADLFPAESQTGGSRLKSDVSRVASTAATSAAGPPADGERATRDFLQFLNRRHLAERTGNSDLEARIAAHELAARLQLSAPEVTAIDSEPRSIHELYQTGDEQVGPFGKQCLLARRLVEQGVRFVQIYCGAENTTAEKIRPNWDSHEDLVRDHGYWGRVLDTGASALLSDLKQRGMLDETLVICSTEFGRQPAAQGGKGRDHNAGAFTAWMAGGGIRGGVGYGATDELGFAAVENATYSYDLHATALHLLGIDHERLTWYHNGIERRLTDVHGHVIHDVLN